MMQEVGGDDTNGESTFEFVEGGGHPSEVAASSANEQLTPSAVNLMTTAPAVGSGLFDPLTPDASRIPSQFLPSVPPPMALPSFVSPSPSYQISPAAATVASPTPLYFSSSVPSGMVTSQPAYPQPPPSVVASPLIYTPTPASTALELPMMDYAGGYSAVTQLTPDKENNAGMWGWIKGTVSGKDFLNKVAEKAKNSVDSMITTLDPQMKDYIYSGGDIDLIVTSDKEDKIGPVREAFQTVFGRASVSGMAIQTNIAIQPVGYSAGLKGAEDRISCLRQSGRIHERQPVVAIENFVVELTPDRWFDIGCLVLDDPAIESPIHVYTQSTPVPLQYINEMQKDTGSDYPLRWSGLAVPVGHVIGRALQVPHTEWHLHVTGVSRRDIVLVAAKSLATAYKMSRSRAAAPATPIWQ